MSIILDALRKSEAARRRNETPALFDVMPTAAEPATKRPRWPLWSIGMIGTVGIASLALALWLTARGDPVRTNEAVATPDEARAAIDHTQAQAASNASADPARDPSIVASTAAPAVATPAATMPAPMPTSPGIPMPETSATAPPAVIQMPAPMPRSASTAGIPATTEMPPSRDAFADPPPVAPPAATIEQPQASQAFRSPANDAPLALADLDAGTRKQLPPLKLSMHVWNDVAAQRFVILDGQRLREGDVLGEVVIERITRDGAMLSWRGTSLSIEWR
jgi:general secretion pathway protein B